MQPQQLMETKEIVQGTVAVAATFGLMEINALIGCILGTLSILYLARKWVLMEKSKKKKKK